MPTDKVILRFLLVGLKFMILVFVILDIERDTMDVETLEMSFRVFEKFDRKVGVLYLR